MPARNTRVSFGWVSMVLHWSTVILVVFQFVIGVGDIDVFGDFEDTHATVGVSLLVVTVLRYVWRKSVPLPDWPPQLSSLQRRLVHLVEMTLYAMLIAKPVTGLLLLGADGEDAYLFGLIELPQLWPEDSDHEDFFEQAHFLSGVVLLAALACHVALALTKRLLPRMIPFGSARPTIGDDATP